MSVRRARQQARRDVRTNKKYTRSLIRRSSAPGGLSAAEERIGETAPEPAWRGADRPLSGVLNTVNWRTPRTVFSARRSGHSSRSQDR